MASPSPPNGDAPGARFRWLDLSSWGVSALILPLVISLFVFVFLPLLIVVWGSFDGARFDFSTYQNVFTDSIYTTVLRRTFKIGIAVTGLCIAFGYPLAYLLTVVGKRTAVLMTSIIMVPLLTGVLIRMYAWMIIFGREGIINDLAMQLGLVTEPMEILYTSFAVHVGMLHVLSPIAIFTMYSSMVQIDRQLVQAAEVLGASPVRSFLRVYLPMSLPGTIAAAVLVFVISIGYFIAPILLGAPSDTMISQLIISEVNTLLDFPMGFTLALVLLLATFTILAVASLFIPLDLLWTSQGAGVAPGSRRTGMIVTVRRWAASIGRAAFIGVEAVLNWLLQPVVRWVPVALRVYGAAALFFLTAPILVIFILSFSSAEVLIFPPPGYSWRWYEAFYYAEDWHSALWFSIKLGGSVAAVAVLIGACGAFALVRGRLPGRQTIFLLALSPVIIPEIILALALYIFQLKAHVLGTFLGLAIGHLVLATPYVVVVMTAAVRGLDPDLEHAAAVHGARPMQTIRRVLIPLLRPSLLTSAFFAFLVSFDLLVISIFLIGRMGHTLPLKFWADIKFETNPLLSAASSLIITAIVVSVVVIQWWRYRSSERVVKPSGGVP